jgi:hypothetical protein
VRKPISEISFLRFGETDGKTQICCDPSSDDIDAAINSRNLETRSFQDDLELLKSEWHNEENFEKRCTLIKQYHARRIAFFVVNGWDDPIVLNVDSRTVKDGLLRLRAAIHMRWDMIDAATARRTAAHRKPNLRRAYLCRSNFVNDTCAHVVMLFTSTTSLTQSAMQSATQSFIAAHTMR